MKISNKPQIIIVNKDDEIIGRKTRDSLDKDDIYRVSALWITNSQKQILLAKRHHTKSHNPNMWGPAVAGTVEEGETYESNIIKETEEEIGLKNIQPKLGQKTETNDEYHHFTQWYVLNIDKDIDEFRIQENEVEGVKWFSLKELEGELQKYPKNFLPKMSEYLKLFS